MDVHVEWVPWALVVGYSLRGDMGAELDGEKEPAPGRAEELAVQTVGYSRWGERKVLTVWRWRFGQPCLGIEPPQSRCEKKTPGGPQATQVLISTWAPGEATCLSCPNYADWSPCFHLCPLASVLHSAATWSCQNSSQCVMPQLSTGPHFTQSQSQSHSDGLQGPKRSSPNSLLISWPKPTLYHPPAHSTQLHGPSGSQQTHPTVSSLWAALMTPGNCVLLFKTGLACSFVAFHLSSNTTFPVKPSSTTIFKFKTLLLALLFSLSFISF